MAATITELSLVQDSDGSSIPDGQSNPEMSRPDANLMNFRALLFVDTEKQATD